MSIADMPKATQEDRPRTDGKHRRVVGADWASAHGVIERPSSLMKELGINPKLYAQLRHLPQFDRTLFLTV